MLTYPEPLGPPRPVEGYLYFTYYLIYMCVCVCVCAFVDRIINCLHFFCKLILLFLFYIIFYMIYTFFWINLINYEAISNTWTICIACYSRRGISKSQLSRNKTVYRTGKDTLASAFINKGWISGVIRHEKMAAISWPYFRSVTGRTPITIRGDVNKIEQ